MDTHIYDFYSLRKKKKGRFQDVIDLQKRQELSFEEAQALAPKLPRGWFELSRLSVEDRIEFTGEYWLGKIPYHPSLKENISSFFSRLDDIAIFLSQENKGDPYEAAMVFSLKDDGGFYRAAPPATYEECIALQSEFTEFIFPEDYFAFLQIHNGLHKTTDRTGLIPVQDIRKAYDLLQETLRRQDDLKTRKGKLVDTTTLIPFYESFGLPVFQCFWGEWHHELGMGNIYLSLADNVIADPDRGEHGSDNLSFPTFTEWLLFYLEPIYS